MVKSSVFGLLIGGGIAACGWLIELIRGWRIERAIRRGEDPNDY